MNALSLICSCATGNLAAISADGSRAWILSRFKRIQFHSLVRFLSAIDSLF